MPTEKLIEELENFTCIMYGYPRESSIDCVRFKALKKMIGDDELLTLKSKVDLARLPPCRNSLVPHIQRTNYRVRQYKSADKAIVHFSKPYDEGQGWHKNERGNLEPIWSYGQILPKSIIDIVESTTTELENSDHPDITVTDNEDAFDIDEP